jgi:hypothetical protein
MSNEGTAAARFPIRFADIIFARDVLDPNGQNPKLRRVVVLTPDAALAAGHPIVAAAVTGTLPPTLTADYVLLPYKNPPGPGHPKTGLTKRAAVHCTWLVTVDPDDVMGRSGFVPPSSMGLVHSKTVVAARALGGWP